jgi:hypothetical protein
VGKGTEERRGEGRTEKEGRGGVRETGKLGKVREEREGAIGTKGKEGREEKSGSPPDLWPCTPAKNPAGALEMCSTFSNSEDRRISDLLKFTTEITKKAIKKTSRSQF